MIRFIDEARSWWKMFSIHAMAAAIAIQGAWDAAPPSMVAGLPAGIVQKVTIVLLVLGILGRLVKQDSVGNSAPPAP